MRYRQIHLDFHTSEHIPGIGSRFDPDDFADTLAEADVELGDGVLEVPSRLVLSPDQGRQDPSASRFRPAARPARRPAQAQHQRAGLPLGRLGRALGARASRLARRLRPKACWSASAASRSGRAGPSWTSTRPISTTSAGRSRRPMELFPEGNGLFIDICLPRWSRPAPGPRPRWRRRGLDWTDPENQVKQAEETQIEFFERVRKAALKRDPKRPLFFNFGHVRRGRRDILKYFSPPRDRVAAHRLLGLRALPGQRPLRRDRLASSSSA